MPRSNEYAGCLLFRECPMLALCCRQNADLPAY